MLHQLAGATFALNVEAGEYIGTVWRTLRRGYYGQVQIVYSGTVKFVAPATGALTANLGKWQYLDMDYQELWCPK